MPVLFDRTCILCGRVLPVEKHSAALCPDCAAIAERRRRAVGTGNGKFAVIPVFRAYLARTVRTQRRAVLFDGKDPAAQDARPVE